MNAQTLSMEAFMERVKDLGSYKPVDGMTDAERVNRAKQVFRSTISTETAVALETCIRCGMCAEACHFYRATEDPRYTPALKFKPLRNFYRRELGPMRWLHRLVSPELKADTLRQWRELVYDSCTECGRCDQICPMGIRISPMVGIMRRALKEAGLMPLEFQALVEEQDKQGSTLGLGVEQLRQACEELRGEGIAAPLDKEKASVMLVTTVSDLAMFRDAFRATARVLNRLGVDWTLRSATLQAANLCFVSGDQDTRVRASKVIAQEAQRCEARTVIVPECGMAYAVLRWDAPNLLETPPQFKVLALAEFLGEEIREGRLKIRPGLTGKVFTYHDPCKLGRHGGVFDEPRQALKATGVEVREMESHARTNFCCGGGSGVFLLQDAQQLRQKAFELKKSQVERCGAEAVVTACDSCRINLSQGASRANWDMPVHSLVCLVADNMAQ